MEVLYMGFFRLVALHMKVALSASCLLSLGTGYSLGRVVFLESKRIQTQNLQKNNMINATIHILKAKLIKVPGRTSIYVGVTLMKNIT
jgi:hypothetical protein